MGCAFCRKKPNPTVVINGANQNGYKDLFYATNEFDLSRSESEDENENYSLNFMKPNKQQVTKKVISSSNEVNSTNNVSSTVVNDVSNNQIIQTGVE
jgi:hypothetical protein